MSNNAVDKPSNWTIFSVQRKLPRTSLRCYAIHKSVVFPGSCSALHVCSNSFQIEWWAETDMAGRVISRSYWYSSYAELFLNMQSELLLKFSLKNSIVFAASSCAICSCLDTICSMSEPNCKSLNRNITIKNIQHPKYYLMHLSWV